MTPEATLAGMRRSLIAYTMAMNPRYDPAPHHRLIASKLESAFRGETKRLMIFAPPRHGKSELVSKSAPAWFLGSFPNRKIITASHTARLAEDFGGQVRDLIADPLHTAAFGPRSGLNPATTAKGDFKTLSKGEYFAVGVGGTPIGKGGDVIIIDDPIKSRKEAESATYRKELKDWYRSSMYSRLEGDGVVIVMHQRWHEDDLAGWLLTEHAEENWDVVSLPALATEPDQFGRVPGEALWWKRYDEERLLAIARMQGPRDFLSMYQQQPRSQDGDEFKKEYLNYYKSEPEIVARGMTVYIIVDAASSKKKGSDFTAMVVIGVGHDGNKYLLDGVRARLKLSERAETLMALHKKWRPRYTGYEQYGQMADIEHIQTVMEQDNYRFNIEPLGGRVAKVERIRRLLPDMENGTWYFPEELWVKDENRKPVDLIQLVIDEEMLPFPVGRHDDFVDALSRIYDMNIIKPAAPQDDMASGVSTKGPRPW